MASMPTKGPRLICIKITHSELISTCIKNARPTAASSLLEEPLRLRERCESEINVELCNDESYQTQSCAGLCQRQTVEELGDGGFKGRAGEALIGAKLFKPGGQEEVLWGYHQKLNCNKRGRKDH